VLLPWRETLLLPDRPQVQQVVVVAVLALVEREQQLDLLEEGVQLFLAEEVQVRVWEQEAQEQLLVEELQV